jgi:hypothetical protein
LPEKSAHYLTFVAQYRDGFFDRFAIDPLMLLRENYNSADDVRARQQQGSLKLGEVILVYRDRQLLRV